MHNIAAVSGAKIPPALLFIEVFLTLKEPETIFIRKNSDIF